jgi:hypothetical protein
MKALRHPLLLASLCCLLALSAQAAEKGPAAPADVMALADRAAACQRWSGTEITDQSDDTLVEDELAHLKCASLAADVAKLKQKYANSDATLKVIEAVNVLGF